MKHEHRRGGCGVAGVLALDALAEGLLHEQLEGLEEVVEVREVVEISAGLRRRRHVAVSARLANGGLGDADCSWRGVMEL